ncbi:MAG: tetratricopeptide repeat protein [Desulfomonile sp.]|nr:tetratricopeptide repeat protein [Desulfomonile sp.]
MLHLLSVGAADDPPDFKRGVALRAERRDSEAIEAFKRVLSVSPDHTESLVHMGASLEDLGDLKGAERVYRKALEKEPDHAAARRNLDHLLAARDINAAPSGPKASEDLLFTKGLNDLERNEFDAALAAFRLLRGFNPEDPRPLFYTALVWERRGDHDRTRAAYKQAIQAFPGYAPARVNFVVFLLEVGDRPAAAREARAAADAIPGDPRVRYLARLLEAGTNTDNASDR